MVYPIHGKEEQKTNEQKGIEPWDLEKNVRCAMHQHVQWDPQQGAEWQRKGWKVGLWLPGAGGRGVFMSDGHRASVSQGEKSHGDDHGDGCTRLWMYLLLWTRAFKNGLHG